MNVPKPSTPLPTLVVSLPSRYQRLIAAGMRGWMAEVQKRFHSHTMAQYRARFHAMYSLAMAEGSPFPAAVLGQHALPWSAPIDFDDIELGQVGLFERRVSFFVSLVVSPYLKVSSDGRFCQEWCPMCLSILQGSLKATASEPA